MATVEEILHGMSTLQGQQHALNQEISRLTEENKQYRQARSPGLAELRLQFDKQFRQRFPMRTHDRVKRTKSGRHQRSWETSCVHKRICDIHSLAQEDHGVSDCSVWTPFCTSGIDRKRKLRYRAWSTIRSGSVETVGPSLDPLSGGKRTALLRQILVPGRCKLQDLPAGLEK